MEQVKIKTYGPDEKWPTSVILPTQTHGNNIVEIVTGKEDLSDCDGIWTQNLGLKSNLISTPPSLPYPGEELQRSFTLGIKTADCAPIVFWDEKSYGIVHAGWRGLCNGIIEKMMAKFNNPKVWVGPILPKFEIQKDFCYEAIYTKFGDRFFTEIVSDFTLNITPPTPPLKGEELKRYLFDFKSALASVLPMAEFDDRSTYDEKSLASWRRDQDKKRNLTVVSV